MPAPLNFSTPPLPLEGRAQAKAERGLWGLDCKLLPSSGHSGREEREQGRGEPGRERAEERNTEKSQSKGLAEGDGGGRMWETEGAEGEATPVSIPMSWPALFLITQSACPLGGHISHQELHPVVCDRVLTHLQSSSRVGNS